MNSCRGRILQPMVSMPIATLIRVSIFALAFQTWCQPLTASEFYVNQTGGTASDSNVGSIISPWLTCQHAADVAIAGDLVHVVGPATYDELVVVKNSGIPTASITFIGEGKPIVRGFNVTGKNYISIIGFEITHPNTNYNFPGVELLGANNCEILDCYIHHVNGQGVDIHGWNAYGNRNIIRGNRIDYAGMCQTNVGTTSGATGIAFSGTNNLCEYNEISFCGDFFNGFGYQNILRNNYLHDINSAVINPDPHVDGLQQSPATQNLDAQWTLFENNYCESNWLSNSHGIILRNSVAGKSVNNLICRQNVFDHIGSVFIQSMVPFVRAYNNTVSHCSDLTGNGYVVLVSDDTAATAANNSFLNNIFYQCSGNKGPVYAVASSDLPTFFNDFDLRYSSGSSFGPAESHGIAADPAFSGGFHLGISSPAISGGGPETVAVGGGSSTNAVPVADAGFFCDGWGSVEGDWVTVGSNAPVQITNVDYAQNLLRVSESIGWSKGSSVRLLGTQDIGAYPYLGGGYSYGVGLITPTNGATEVGSTIISAVVTNASLVRFVKFYVDGRVVGSCSRSPYSVSYSFDTQPHRIEARAYPLYADTNLNSSSYVNINFAILPSPPTGLRFISSGP